MLMIQQALGTPDISCGARFGTNIYLPRLSELLCTLPVHLRRHLQVARAQGCWFSAAISLASAPILSGAVRLILSLARLWL